MVSAFLLCVSFEMMGFGDYSVLRCIPEGSRGFAARVESVAGLLALGAKGSVRDRLTPLYRLNFREADTSGRRDLNDERGNETGGLPGD